MTKPTLKKPGPAFEYPALKRSADDYAAALSAFERLYRYGRTVDEHVISILAVYKGLQKLEQEWGYDADQVITGHLAPVPLPAPQWLREGVWLCLETFIANPAIALGGSKRPRTFRQALSKHLKDYEDWNNVRQAAEGTTVEKALKSVYPGEERTARRAYNRIKDIIESANELPCVDAAGNTLSYVEARDLVPTGQLSEIYKSTF